MTQQQFNPPFDRSAPCPACQHEVRSVSALIHNLLNRCDVGSSTIRDGKAWVRLWDLRHTTFPAALTVPHPVADELMAVGRALVEATEDMTSDGLTIKGSAEIRARVEALIPRAAAASDAFNALSVMHFDDQRHCSGSHQNILREWKGYSWNGHVPGANLGGEYNYTVEVVSEGGDIAHTACGTHLKLHDHFKQNIARDPEFYGQVWCPSCRQNVPMWQFEISEAPHA
ncbi:hypothetical protein [Novosphingobium sp.]|uniref:hypothetical protein n=1 Tax=Novosphingobium sp. TaxID=1874826 RepID=UPI0038BAE316